MVSQKKSFKCVVWDLDNTLWEGTLLEDGDVKVIPTAEKCIRELDKRGILQSIASRNEHDYAIQKLKDFGLDHFFLYPQISWSSKSSSIKDIVSSLNIGLDTVLFVDDQAFERDEVRFTLPRVRTLDATDVKTMLDIPELNPSILTEDSRNRRQMYIDEIERNNAEKEHIGSQTEFLATLDMCLTIRRAEKRDLLRAEELTIRTNQLNSTGYTYSYAELETLIDNPQYSVWVASLEDKYGSYGTIGLVLIEHQTEAWVIKLLLMSCRVMNRGVGSIILSFIISQTRQNNIELFADFRRTDRNRMMYIAYKFAGFKEYHEAGDKLLLKYTSNILQKLPSYVTLTTAIEI